jgi:hypothetical protein
LELARLRKPSLGPGAARLADYQRLVDLIEEVPGDIVVCGVGNGTSLFTLGVLTSGHRRLWGFDSFGERLPPPQAEDEPDEASPSRRARPRKKIEAKKTARSESHLRSLIVGYRLPSGRRISPRQLRYRLTLVGGLSPAHHLEYPDGRPIALLHLNLHRYQTCDDCLSSFEPKVAPGGVVVFDQYRTPGASGVTRAIEEYYGGPPAGIERGAHWRAWHLVKPSTST